MDVDGPGASVGAVEPHALAPQEGNEIDILPESLLGTSNIEEWLVQSL